MNLRTLTLCGAIAATALPQTSHADLYHAVENGETLSSIAARYKSTPDILRAANKLVGINNGARLDAMLLIVPEGPNSVAASIPVLPGLRTVASTPSARTAAIIPATSSAPVAAPSAMSGTITRSLRYTVQSGDTIESIAARHAASGYNVSADVIRERNNLLGNPSAGQTLVVPVQSTVYRAPGYNSGMRTISSSTEELAGGASLSSEMMLPTAREIKTAGAPAYQDPGSNSTRAAKAKARLAQSSERRGPTSLSSRSYSPSGGDIRVLGPQEEAPNIGEAPQSRVRTTAPQVRASGASRIAHVAKIALNGARIRRLPDAEAVTLYSCKTGTEIAVTRQSGAWSAVLMSDRSTGWVPTRYLKMTDQQVDISSIALQESALPRRSGKYAYSGNFSSNNPVVANALSYMGTPYVWGGNTKRGIDCSGLVKNAFASAGYSLPRTAAQQSKVGLKVDPSQLREGDRLYFSASGSRVDHTGLYLGNGLFVHASGSGRAVIVSNLFDSRNWNIFVGARR
jgi:cell wall-associated NlpC family hydrolase